MTDAPHILYFFDYCQSISIMVFLLNHIAKLPLSEACPILLSPVHLSLHSLLFVPLLQLVINFPYIIIPDTSGMVATDKIVVSATALDAIS